MSRIGKKIITIPAGVEVKIQDSTVAIKGPKGDLVVNLPPHVSVVQNEATKALEVKVKDENNGQDCAFWGLGRQLLNNAVLGVQKPFEKSLEFVGVGFRIALEGSNKVKMEVGFSHPVIFELPAGLSASVEKQILTLSSIDKQLVGETAASIRRIRRPEPYKGKGIKYVDEVIRRKAGKAAAK